MSAVNPNKLPEDQKVLYLGTGYQYASAWTSVYAYALAKNDTRCFVYEFNPRGFNYSDNASFNGYYTINIPQGLDESAVFASTPPYSGLLFMLPAIRFIVWISSRQEERRQLFIPMPEVRR